MTSAYEITEYCYRCATTSAHRPLDDLQHRSRRAARTRPHAGASDRESALRHRTHGKPRRAHAREEFPKRDDMHWLTHTLCWLTDPSKGNRGGCIDMRPDMVPGANFPDYELSDHTGKHRKLSELQGQDPMVLVLSRGGFCPKDRRQHDGLVQLHRELEVGYCRLVTISTDNITETNENGTGLAPTGPSSPTRGGSCSRTSTSPNTLMPATTQ